LTAKTTEIKKEQYGDSSILINKKPVVKATGFFVLKELKKSEDKNLFN